MKIGKEIITFGDIETQKQIFHRKFPIFLGNVDTDNVSVSNKTSSGEKNY